MRIPSSDPIRPVHQWFGENGDGFVLNDPISGEPMHPNRPPAFLAYAMREEYDLLYRQAQITGAGVFITEEPQVAASELGPSPDDDPDDAPYEALLDYASAVAYGVDHTTPDQDALRVANMSMSLAEGWHGISEYHARILAGIAMWPGLPSFPIGITAPSDQRTTTDATVELIRHAAVNYQSDYEMTHQAAKVIADNIWQWHAIGRLASGMIHAQGSLDRLLRRADYDDADNVMIVLPANHADMARKLGLYGMNTHLEKAHATTYTDSYVWSERVSQLGYIPYDMIDGVEPNPPKRRQAFPWWRSK